MKLRRPDRAPRALVSGARWVLWEELDDLRMRVKTLEEASARDRSRLDLGMEFAHAFENARQTSEYQAVFDEAEPLVSVIVATYNRSSLLLERSLDSLLHQTYRNLQVVVVGDHCTDDTFELLSSIDDPRLEAVNLPVRGPYPADGRRRWMVAGSPAMNAGLKRARGSFITHLDDDDRHADHRVELLVEKAQETRSELLWHPFRHEMPSGEWVVNPARDFVAGQVTTSSIFYHRWLAGIPWDIDAHYSLEPGDWNRLRKFLWLDVHSSRVDDVLLDHYRERNNA